MTKPNLIERMMHFIENGEHDYNGGFFEIRSEYRRLFQNPDPQRTTLLVENIDLALLKRDHELFNKMLWLSEADSNGVEVHYCADEATRDALISIQLTLYHLVIQAEGKPCA